MDLTDKGRNLLAPDNPETFIIPDLGEMLLEIDGIDDLSSIEME